ncbi:hypothetical protein D1816_21555 [Aquimarina sp. AD10]|uniref:Peptidase M56 domain-containing protein n=1 Tax=Aquimarina aggregata TaxID=1642818 RepID=A0A163CUE6_9FLAO|nr:MULTISPECIES: hypothetical protein [Aquimarina]AXT62817.1 hypothetical protein D1816_21555 [Aquimarina sp. AD10]KZS42770.1 hypothetical protein AWE51_15475 [Aquimarina aggregata]RKN02001.1 hypothetical protein D7033_02920 [Aquimarina sp. AD10]
MRIVVNKYLIGRHFVGIALWPFIVVKDPFLKKDEYFINHEKIHLRQQVELLVIPFYFLYFTEYCFRLLQYRNAQLAYCNISFEREAYLNEDDLHYLKRRKPWSFIKYL